MSERKEVLRAFVLLAAGGALFLLPLTAAPQSFPYPPGGSYSDALIAHLTSARFLGEAVGTAGQIPLWNPHLLSGIPFAADPLSGLWYPPFWFLAVFPSALSLNLILLSHLAFGGLGMYLWMRREGVGDSGALAAGLLFAGMPKLIGHIGLGHLSLVAAVCWTPWVLRQARTAWDASPANRGARPFLLLGLILGITFLADPRWIPPLGLTAAGLTAWGMRGARPGARPALRAAAATLLGFAALAAGLALPLAEFTRLSTRASLTAAEAGSLALPPIRLLEIVVPTRGGWGEWTIGAGAGALVLSVLAAARWPKRTGVWVGLVAASLLLALGDATPLGALAARTPGLDLIRVPARWGFLAGVGTCVLAGWGLSAATSPEVSGSRRAARLALAAAVTAIVALNAAAGVVGGRAVDSIVTIAFLLAVAGAIWPGRSRGGGSKLSVILLALLALETAWIDSSLVVPRDQAAALEPGRRVARALGDRPAESRVFSPSYAVPQEAAVEMGIDLADGVHPLQLEVYVAYMGRAAGFDHAGYSVTLPPFPSGDPKVAWGAELDLEALGRLAISRVVSDYPLEATTLQLEEMSDGVWIYSNPSARPRAWVEPDAAGQDWNEVLVIERTPNRIVLTASGPGRLVLSEIVYPGWRASVDEHRTPIVAHQGVFRSVRIGPGEHQVRFDFLPVPLLAGLAVSLVCLGAVAALWRAG